MKHVRRIRNRVIELIKTEKRIQGAWAIPRQELNLSKCKFEGIYILVTDKGDALYVGRTNNLANRLNSHFEYRTNSSIFMDFVHAGNVGNGDPEIEDALSKILKPTANSRKANNRVIATIAGHDL